MAVACVAVLLLVLPWAGAAGAGGPPPLVEEEDLPLQLPQHLPDSEMAAGFTPPWFCHGIDCPEFTVDESFTAVEGASLGKGEGTLVMLVHLPPSHHPSAISLLPSQTPLLPPLQPCPLRDVCAGVERRHYSPTKWAVIRVNETNYDKAMGTGFRVSAGWAQGRSLACTVSAPSDASPGHCCCGERRPLALHRPL